MPSGVHMHDRACRRLQHAAASSLSSSDMCCLPYRYGHEHAAVDLQKTAVYGLTELYREQIKGARLLANPGCYPTCAQVLSGFLGVGF